MPTKGVASRVSSTFTGLYKAVHSRPLPLPFVLGTCLRVDPVRYPGFIIQDTILVLIHNEKYINALAYHLDSDPDRHHIATKQSKILKIIKF